jgi:DASS family divalent anion:Na+ symporter
MSRYKGVVVPIVFLGIWLFPVPAGLTAQAWLLLAIFLATIAGLIIRPIPMGAVVIVGIAVTALLGVVSPRTALSGFSNPTIWLIVVAFLFARAFIITGLGKRIAFHFISLFGKHTLGLAYSVVLSDLVLAPATPSNTARAGGILYPIVRSLAVSLGSEPGDSARRVGAFLIKTEYQCVLVTSAMFLTAMAANPLAVELAAEVADVQVNWGMWALAALVPGLISLALIPFILYKIYPPEIKSTPEAPEWARRELSKLGPISSEEKVLSVVFFGILFAWATSQFHSVHATVIALSGVSALLITRVLSWKDVLEEKGAWDALIWFGGLVMMASQLNELGFIPWFAQNVSAVVSELSWLVALTVLLLVYFYAHYSLASMTAHVTAMYPVFLVAAVAAGAPPLLSALAFGFFSNLNASLTHYGSGPAPIYFGSGYVEFRDWWKLGFLISILNIIIWIGIGFPYWRLLGLW